MSRLDRANYEVPEGRLPIWGMNIPGLSVNHTSGLDLTGWHCFHCPAGGSRRDAAYVRGEALHHVQSLGHQVVVYHEVALITANAKTFDATAGAQPVAAR